MVAASACTDEFDTASGERSSKFQNLFSDDENPCTDDESSDGAISLHSSEHASIRDDGACSSGDDDAMEALFEPVQDTFQPARAKEVSRNAASRAGDCTPQQFNATRQNHRRAKLKEAQTRSQPTAGRAAGLGGTRPVGGAAAPTTVKAKSARSKAPAPAQEPRWLEAVAEFWARKCARTAASSSSPNG